MISLSDFLTDQLTIVITTNEQFITLYEIFQDARNIVDALSIGANQLAGSFNDMGVNIRETQADIDIRDSL